MLTKSYNGLCLLPTFEERFEYLKLHRQVGDETFGYNRIFNQYFYHSSEWRRTRRRIILRDNGCDMGLEGWEIKGPIYVHHINAVTLEDIEDESDILYDPNNLICVSYTTHEAIHFGSSKSKPQLPIERVPGDTCPWR